jgi:hypothetical protein
MVRAAYSLVVGISSVLTAAAPALHAPVLRLRQTNETAGLTFADILPSSEINWVDCYKAKFQCSYLTVPLDYENITAGTTDVAFVRYLVNKNAEDLLINPGKLHDLLQDTQVNRDCCRRSRCIRDRVCLGLRTELCQSMGLQSCRLRP